MDKRAAVLAVGSAAAAAVGYLAWRRRKHAEVEPAPPGGWPAKAFDVNARTSAPEHFCHPAFPTLPAETAAVMASRKPFAAKDVLTLWDGSKRTGPEHLEWMLQHLKQHVQKTAPGFRNIGHTGGASYEIHDELTAKGDGYGYFRLNCTVNVSPAMFTAVVMNPLSIAAIDPTLRYMTFDACAYPDGRTWLVYWRAKPPAPLLWDLDGFDLSTYKVDTDGTIWQYSVSVPHEISEAKTAIRAVNMYWGYKLVPVNGGQQTQLTLVCQSALNNAVPKWLGNKFVCQVLADYVRGVERAVGLWTASGKMQALQARCGLS